MKEKEKKLTLALLWKISNCPFCHKPVRGEEWLEGKHMCKRLEEALKIIKEGDKAQ